MGITTYSQCFSTRKKVVGDSENHMLFIYFDIHDISRTVYKNKYTIMLINFKYPLLV